MKETKFEWTLIGIIILLIIFSICLIYNNSNPKTSLTPLSYPFQINSDNDWNGPGDYYITQFIFNYDFEKRKGEYNFRIEGKKSKQITITVPQALKIEDIVVNNIANEEEKIGQSYNQNRILLTGSPQSIINISIKVKDKDKNFYPNGEFGFYSNAKGFYLENNPDKETRYNILTNLKFGKTYRCNDNCFINHNFNYTKQNNFLTHINQDSLTITLDENSEEIYMPVVFSLSTYNAKRRENSQFWLNIGISLLTGLIIFLLETISHLLKIHYKIKP